MSWFRKHLGLDGFDLTIHVAVTMMLMVMASMSNGPEEMYPLITGASLVVLGIRRALVLRRDVRPGLTTGEMAAERIAELEQRVAAMEERLLELEAERTQLEERVDFAERLLSQAGEPKELDRRKAH